MSHPWVVRAEKMSVPDFWESEYGKGSVNKMEALQGALLCGLCVEVVLLLLVGVPLLAAFFVHRSMSPPRP